MYHGHVANINDVARRAGVSPTTAKRAIRDPAKLAPATLERVRLAIEELHYEPDQVASALRSGQGNNVGLIIGSIVEPFFAQLTRVIGRGIRKRGHSLIMADNEYRSDLELDHLRTFMGNRVAGLIVRSGYGEPNTDYLLRMRRRGIAVVEVDYFTPGSPLAHVMLDNAGAVEAGVAHLAAHGHERISALASYHPTVNPDERVQSFPLAMASNGLELPDEYLAPIPPVDEDAYRMVRRVMALDRPPTAIFALTGTMATGAYSALRELGLRVPQDVSVLAFDDYPWMDLVSPGIDTLAQPVDRMGEAAIRVLFEQIDGGPKAPVEQLRLSAQLIVRGSVRPPPARVPKVG